MDAESRARELSEFREQWRAEIKQRPAHALPSGSPSHGKVDSEPWPTGVQGAQNGLEVGLKPLKGISPPHVHADISAAPPRISKVFQAYRLAVQSEQAGDLDGALRLYKNAFGLDSNVDKAYCREERLLEAAPSHPHNASVKEHTNVILPNAYGLGAARPEAEILVHLLASFPNDLHFDPWDEMCSAPLQLLPDEIVIRILKALDPNSIERFALLNRKARVLSLDSSIWRDLVQRTYIPPQIPPDVKIESLAWHYLYDYRRLYVEHPRLRLDGVFIAVCHYIRPGLNTDNVWVNVSHLITYHRYLRFFANGTALSLLANEDVDPQAIVPLLKPSLRMKGLFIGNWSLEGSMIQICDLMDPSGGNARYTFQMTLELKSRPLGRWNKLDLAGYDSVNKENGEAIPVGLKHERPFWFSRVRSYVV